MAAIEGDLGTRTREGGRLDSLTGLRFLAAFVVFGLHLVVFFPSFGSYVVNHLVAQGGTGVSFFFVLSGFVLTWSHRPDDSSGGFYRRRVARIVPSHVVMWAVTALLLWAVVVLPSKRAALAQLFLVSPWVPNVHTVGVMNVPAWSLGCEMFFYALFPLLLPRLSRLSSGQRRATIGALVLSMLLIAAVTSPAAYPTRRYWAVYFFPAARLPEFLIGMALALEVVSGRWPRLRVSTAAALALSAYLAAGWVAWPYSVAVVTIIPFSILIAAAAQHDTSAATAGSGLLASRTLVRLGVWSYAFYLVHWPVMIAMAHLYPGSHGLRGSVAIAVGSFAVVLASAALVHSLVERPFELLLRGSGSSRPSRSLAFSARRVLVTLAAGASVIGVGGIAAAAVSQVHGSSPHAVVDSLAPQHGGQPVAGADSPTASRAAVDGGSSPVASHPAGSSTGPSPAVSPSLRAGKPAAPTNQALATLALCNASNLGTRVVTDQSSYLVGEPVKITMTLTNHSDASCEVVPQPCYPMVVVENLAGAPIWTYGGSASGVTCSQPRQAVTPRGVLSLTVVWNPVATQVTTSTPSLFQVTGSWLGGTGPAAPPVQISAP